MSEQANLGLVDGVNLLDTSIYAQVVATNALRTAYGFELLQIKDEGRCYLLAEASGERILFLVGSRYHKKDSSSSLVPKKALADVEALSEKLQAIPAYCHVAICEENNLETRIIAATTKALKLCAEDGGEINRPVQKKENGDYRLTYTNRHVPTIQENPRLAYMSVTTTRDPKNAYLSTFTLNK
ncbi:hypothetical protein [Trueperella sp. LYQ141]|uniref:hypothetical protein n=1 Tax=Trueperella sp. LYQ141 TaxID=3391058 RepID=UPI003983080D